MSGIGQEQLNSNMEERCQELIVVARQWEEQMSDLRNFTQIEKETLEGEISSLKEVGDKNEVEKQSLENSLMTLEEERVWTCASNDLSVQRRTETEVKLQLMESALEAVSLQNTTADVSNQKVDVLDSSTSTDDLIPAELQSEDKKEHETPDSLVTNHVSKQGFDPRADQDADKLALQLEVRKLRHQLIVSQITAKQFKSECLLYKTKAMGKTTFPNKKRKEFHASPGGKGPPMQKQSCPRIGQPSTFFQSRPALSQVHLSSRTALQDIDNNRQQCEPAVMTKKYDRHHSKESLTNGKETAKREGESVNQTDAAYSVKLIDGSDALISNICLRM